MDTIMSGLKGMDIGNSARPGWTFASRPGPGRDDLDPGRDRDRDRDDFKNPAGTGIRVIPAGIPGF